MTTSGGCSTAHCQPPHDDRECCTPECPCQEGEGDCDEDADCAAGLLCAQHKESPAWCQVGLSGDCCARIPTTEGIIITGGGGGSAGITSVEVILSNSTLCTLPPLPEARHGHSQSGLTACGGRGSPARDTC